MYLEVKKLASIMLLLPLSVQRVISSGTRTTPFLRTSTTTTKVG